MKKSISFIVLILIFETVTACSETSEDKSATKKTKERITETDEKSVVEKAKEKKDRNKTIEADGWMARGYEAYKIKDYSEAIECYKKAITIEPNLAKAHYSLGNAYYEKGMLDEAISEYKQTIVINPRYAEAHNNLGSTYLKKNALDKAFSEYKHALAINPNLVEAHNNLALVYYSKENYKLALVHCDKAVELGGSVNPKLLESLKPYR